jgi:hypothetical protein
VDICRYVPFPTEDCIDFLPVDVLGTSGRRRRKNSSNKQIPERRRIVFLVPLSGYALDDKTLKVLWSFNTGSLNSAPPMTYSVNGKQYVAVLIGANVVAQGMLAKAPEDKDIQNTSMLFVFGL